MIGRSGSVNGAALNHARFSALSCFGVWRSSSRQLIASEASSEPG
ncbi:hypothetical protein [Nonomuraea guangzhouensis]|nr:hypothetical protein [Nonomuraea guangzhouensis]